MARILTGPCSNLECRIPRDVGDFASDRSNYCRDCEKERGAARRDALDADRSDRECHGDCGRTLPADNFSKGCHVCKECQRAGTLMRKYKLTPEDMEHMWEDQGGECGLKCGDSLELKDAQVDHDHECCPGEKSCGQCVRMLLCQKCNLALHENARWRIPGWVDRATALENTHRADREEAASAAYDDYEVDW